MDGLKSNQQIYRYLSPPLLIGYRIIIIKRVKGEFLEGYTILYHDVEVFGICYRDVAPSRPIPETMGLHNTLLVSKHL